MKSSYRRSGGLRRYLAGAATARAGDEMSGPALLLLGFAATGRPATGSGLLASVTIAGAVGGPVFGALLDRSRRPDRVLAAPWPRMHWARRRPSSGGPAADGGRRADRAAAGLFNPSVAGGWTAQLPGIVTESGLARGSALDALTYSAASLAGPALAAVVAAGFGARAAVLTPPLVALAVPAACSLPRSDPGPAPAARRPRPCRRQPGSWRPSWRLGSPPSPPAARCCGPR